MKLINLTILLFFIATTAIAAGFPYSAVCSISVPIGGGQYAMGSGTMLSYGDDDVGNIITCKHILEDGVAGTITVKFDSGNVYQCKIKKVSQNRDLAMFTVTNPQDPGVVVSEREPSKTEELRKVGWGGEEIYPVGLRFFKGFITGIMYDMNGGVDSYDMSGVVRQGDSGGPVFNTKNELVSIIWGKTDRRTGDEYDSTAGVHYTHVYKFAQGCYSCPTPIQGRPIQGRPIYGPNSPILIETPKPRNDCPTCPKGGACPPDRVPNNPNVGSGGGGDVAALEEKVDAGFADLNEKQKRNEEAINALMQKIDNMVSAKGPQGPTGPAGPQGPPGPNGEDGQSADPNAVAEIVLNQIGGRLSAIEEKLSIISVDLKPKEEVIYYVLVADEAASYWSRIHDYYARAKDTYSQIKVVPVPDYPVGQLPQLVAYSNGIPLGTFRGPKAVEDALALFARGETPKP